MLVHLDTSVLVDAFTGQRRSLPAVRTATELGDVLAFSTLVLFEWLRGPRTEGELHAVDAYFEMDTVTPFGRHDAACAARLSRHVSRARQRQADLAIAACAIESGASFWTMNVQDFEDVPGLRLYRPR